LRVGNEPAAAGRPDVDSLPVGVEWDQRAGGIGDTRGIPSV